MALKKVLIVEDDFIIQMFLKRILLKLGFDVIGHAKSSEEAISIIEKNQPDLILMDIGIKGSKDGVETYKEIKNKYPISIIFITGNSDQATIERTFETNPLGVIFKPISENQLVMKLKFFLEDKSGS
jgi:response regulator of citrate/malate metabolism